MTWRISLIPRKVAGVSTAFKVFFAGQDNGRVRFFVMRGPEIWFTRSYATIHEGLTQLPIDFSWSQNWKRAA